MKGTWPVDVNQWSLLLTVLVELIMDCVGMKIWSIRNVVNGSS